MGTKASFQNRRGRFFWLKAAAAEKYFFNLLNLILDIATAFRLFLPGFALAQKKELA